VIEAVGANADGREEEGAADRLAGSRGTHTLGRDLDVAVLVRCPANELRQRGVAIAVPPRDLDLAVGHGRPREPRRHVDRGLQDRRRAPDQGEHERRGEHGGDLAQRPAAFVTHGRRGVGVT
jgi:hypothetical protein